MASDVKYPFLSLADMDNTHPTLDTMWAQILLSIHRIFLYERQFQ